MQKIPEKEYVLVTGGCGYIGSHMVIELVTKLDEFVIIIDSLDNSKAKCLSRLDEITGKSNKILFF